MHNRIPVDWNPQQKSMFCGPVTVDVSLGEGESRVHKTCFFPRSQSISVNYQPSSRSVYTENIHIHAVVVPNNGSSNAWL